MRILGNHAVLCGKQLEIDNFIISSAHRKRGIGEQLTKYICEHARKIGCDTCELNTYVSNTSSHKFYMNQGFIILGYHMQKLFDDV